MTQKNTYNKKYCGQNSWKLFVSVTPACTYRGGQLMSPSGCHLHVGGLGDLTLSGHCVAYGACHFQASFFTAPVRLLNVAMWTRLPTDTHACNGGILIQFNCYSDAVGI